MAEDYARSEEKKDKKQSITALIHTPSFSLSLSFTHTHPHTHTHTHSLSFPHSHLIELKAHQSFYQSALTTCLMAHNNNSRGIKRLMEILTIKIKKEIIIVNGVSLFVSFCFQLFRKAFKQYFTCLFLFSTAYKGFKFKPYNYVQRRLKLNTVLLCRNLLCCTYLC